MTLFSTLFFDLDDTLYPSASGLWEAIGLRINAFMTDRLGIPANKVIQIRDQFLQQYGTTLNGLISNYQVDPFEYLSYVHDVQMESFLEPDPELKSMLAGLPQKRVIYTNASEDHANQVLELLGIQSCIDQIIDIVALEFINKPRPESYERALSLCAVDEPGTCVLVDDRAVNLLPASLLGMTTVLVGGGDHHPGVDYQITTITDLVSTLPALRAQSEDEPQDAP